MGISEACEALRHYGHDYGRVCEFKAYISPASDTELSQSTRLASDLRQNGVALSLHHPNNNSPSSYAGAKESVMLSDILVFVLDYGAGSSTTIILVTNDHSSLGYPLSLLRNRNCQVVVLSTREMAGQPRYVERLDAIWNTREIQPAPRRSSSPRLPQAARVIQSPHQNRVRSNSRGQTGFALPALLRGTPQLMPASTARNQSPRQPATKRSNSLAFHGEDHIPTLDLNFTMNRYGPSSPRTSPPRNDVSVYHNGREAQPVAQHLISHQMAPSLSQRSSSQSFQPHQFQPQHSVQASVAPTPPNRSRAGSRIMTQPSSLNLNTDTDTYTDSEPTPHPDPPHETPAPQSPPQSVTAAPESPWSFNSVGSNHHQRLALPAPSISDDESHSTITRNGGRVSPSISTQSTNLWLHSESMGMHGGETTYIDMPHGESPLSLGLPTSLAFDPSTASEKTARPEPHAFTFRPPPNLNTAAAPANVSRVGTVEQTDEHRPFGSATNMNFGNPSVHSASTRYDPAGSVMEVRSSSPASTICSSVHRTHDSLPRSLNPVVESFRSSVFPALWIAIRHARTPHPHSQLPQPLDPSFLLPHARLIHRSRYPIPIDRRIFRFRIHNPAYPASCTSVAPSQRPKSESPEPPGASALTAPPCAFSAVELLGVGSQRRHQPEQRKSPNPPIRRCAEHPRCWWSWGGWKRHGFRDECGRNRWWCR